MYKVIAFDCWGTLFTNAQKVHPFAVIAQELGNDIHDKSYLKQFETAFMVDAEPLSKHVDGFLTELHGMPQQALAGKVLELMVASIATQTIYPDTATTLNALQKNYRLALISNTFMESFEALRRKFPIDGWFTDVLLSYDIGVIKPSVKSFELLQSRCIVQPSDILMVGDDYHDDVQAAKEAGITAVLLDRRDRYPDVTDRKIHSLQELNRYLAD